MLGAARGAGEEARMPERAFTIIDETRPVEVTAVVDGDRVRLAAEAVERALGWELTAEGLCRDAMCVPLPAGAGDAGGIDLTVLARALDRPLALDAEEGAAALAAAAAARASALASLEAPDFTLPDLDGRLHSLAEHRGKKVLLVAYASW
jgi:hypothetical protein